MNTYPDVWSVRVHGTPAPQGSKVRMPKGGLVESAAGLGLWRTDVIAACAKQLAADGVTDRPLYPAGTPLDVKLDIYLPPPQKAVALLSRGLPTLPAGKPDEDKLRRAVLDACTLAGVWADDAQIVGAALSGGTRKRWAWGNERPGVLVVVAPVVVPLGLVALWTWSGTSCRRHWRALANHEFTLCGKDMTKLVWTAETDRPKARLTDCAHCDRAVAAQPAWVQVNIP